jgi:hypothetical protein
MAGKAAKQITVEEKRAKYNFIIVDVAPDVSHIDELAFSKRQWTCCRAIFVISSAGHKSEQLFTRNLQRTKNV